jgi:hypothetical protein
MAREREPMAASSGGGGGSAKAPARKGGAFDEMDDDIPF